MGQLGRILDLDRAREVMKLPRRSPVDKAWLIARLWYARLRRVAGRQLRSARGRRFGARLEALVTGAPLVNAPCPVCGLAPADEGIDLFHGLRLRRCSGCHHRFISPRLGPDALAALYDRPYYFEYRVWLGNPIKSESDAEEIVLGHRRLARAELVRPPGSILDVGCASGELLAAARERGYEPKGVEVNPWALDRARRDRGLDVRPGPLTPSTFPDARFDLVTLIDVLEHLDDPVGQLATIAGLLAPGGRVMLVVPNGGCAEATASPATWHHLKPWEHRSLFDCRSLAEAARRAGLRLVDVETEVAGGVGYPGALMAFLRREDDDLPPGAKSIFVRAELARGDTLLVTPLLRGLTRRFPQAVLEVATPYPELLLGLPNVRTLAPGTPARGAAWVTATYVLEPERHVVDAMMATCCAGPPDRHLAYEVREEEHQAAAACLEAARARGRCIAVHPLAGDRIKRWPPAHWRSLGEGMARRGLVPVLLGARGDTATVPDALDLRGRTGLREAAAIVASCEAFVGLDSWLAHLAGAVGTPRVVLFGSTDPERLLCDLDRTPTIALRNDCPSRGCRHDCLPDQWPRNVGCRRNVDECLASIGPDDVLGGLEVLVRAPTRGAP